jgi:pimeloyl-ACP methyl ester carboxylesterase
VARILYLHGAQAAPYGPKTEHFKKHGHEIVGNPRLPFPRLPPWSWRWFLAYLDQTWLREAVQVAQESYDRCQPDVVVGASMGGAVAMNLATGDTPLVLVAPAWRAWFLFRFGSASQTTAQTVVVHGDQDRTIFPRYSRKLLATCRSNDHATLVLEQGLKSCLTGQENGYQLEGRLLLVHGEGHRCNGDRALQALLAGVEVLAALHQQMK